MDINSWLTVIAILMAFLGFLIQQELKVFLLKLGKLEKSAITLILLFFIPFLLFYTDISERFPFLNEKPFAYSWGFIPENIAFILLLLLFVYFLLRISYSLPKQKVTTDLVKTYTEIIEESPSVFWKVFSKYETSYSIENNWKIFEDLIFHPAFLESSLIFSNAKTFLKETAIIKRFHEKKIQIYQQLIDDKQVQKIFNIYNTYDENSNVIEHWSEYRHLFLNDIILQEAIDKYPNVLYSIWSCFDNEQDFQKLFLGFLENRKSAYYTEIRSNWNSYSLLEDEPFLNIVINDNLGQSIHNGVLIIFSDFVLKHLQSEFSKGKTSIYNQEHFSPRIREDNGFELPLYYHIKFIGLLYFTAITITDGIDISTVSTRYTNMQTIYSSMIQQIIKNVNVPEENKDNKYPTNYHWLIGKIFDLQSHWLTSFSDENSFKEKSSYISFIPFSMSLCLSDLYEGLEKGKTTIEFVHRKVYYYILSNYFSCTMNDTLKSSIENEIIRRIPQQLIEPILNFSLDNRFALHYNDFVNENFGNVNDCDREILLRLLKFLRANKMI